MMKMKFLIFGVLFSVVSVYAPAEGSLKGEQSKKEKLPPVIAANITQEHENCLKDAEWFLEILQEAARIDDDYDDYGKFVKFLKEKVPFDEKKRLVYIYNFLSDPNVIRTKIIKVSMDTEIDTILFSLDRLNSMYLKVLPCEPRAIKEDLNDSTSDTTSEGLSCSDRSSNASPSTRLCRNHSDVSEAFLNS